MLSFGSEPPGPIEGVLERSVPHNLLPSIAANLATPDPLLPMQVRLYLSRAMRAAVRDEIASHRPDVVHVTLARLAPYMSGLPPGVHVHVDFVDALSLNMLTRARGSRFPASAAFALEARLMARYEGHVAARADSASVVSERDRLASPGLASAAVIPNGVDLEELAFMAPAERAPVALFFGNLGYFHNIEPARQVALEILPRLRRLAPDVSLRIAGARPAAAVMQLAGGDGVEVAPDVPSMLAELHRAAVAILPSSSGSGIKNKVLEAFAAGTPVVTNPAGINGVVGAGAGSTIWRPTGRTRWPRRARRCSRAPTSAYASPPPRGSSSRRTTAGTAAPSRCWSSMARRRFRSAALVGRLQGPLPNRPSGRPLGERGNQWRPSRSLGRIGSMVSA